MQIVQQTTSHMAWYRVISCLALLALATSGCSLDDRSRLWLPEDPDQVRAVTRQLHLEVSVSRARGQGAKRQQNEIQGQLWRSGLKEGGQRLINRFLRMPLVLRCGQAASPSPLTLLRQSGEFVALADPITGSYRQSFALSATLVPARRFSGRIQAVQDQRDYCAQQDTICIELEQALPEGKVQGYFLIAQPDKVQGPGWVRLVGGGRLVHSQGKLVQGRILETIKEAQTGDIVFLLQLKIAPADLEQG